jgi:outer membrane protein assembly factor BamE (lipoprotein component of BamABCDE complex)
MKAPKRLAVLAVLVAFLGAPAAALAGTELSDEKVATLAIGKTTKAQVQQMFGAPQSRGGSAKGEIWSYRSTPSAVKKSAGSFIGSIASKASPVGVPRVGGSSGTTKSLTVKFDANGVLADYNYQSR